jgi:hypothetical protein
MNSVLDGVLVLVLVPVPVCGIGSFNTGEGGGEDLRGGVGRGVEVKLLGRCSVGNALVVHAPTTGVVNLSVVFRILGLSS